MSKEELIETEHGTIKYRVQTCTSCGEKFNVKEITDVAIGKMCKNKRRGAQNYKFHFKDGYATGKVCPYCRDSPSSYPTIDHALNTAKEKFWAIITIIVAAICIGLAIGVPL